MPRGARWYGSSCWVRIARRFPCVDFPNPYTSAVSMSPCSSRTHASYSAHAASISTWLSEIGGQAPTASSADTNENGAPARSSHDPEQVKPNCAMPVRPLISVMTGASISISASPWSSPLCRVCAKATTAISLFAFICLAPLGGSRPRPGAARTSHEVLDLFEGDVGLVDRLEPLDVVHRAAPLLAGAPRR